MSERWDLCSPIEQHPYPRERLWSDCEDELSEVKQLLQEANGRNQVLADENLMLSKKVSELRQTLKTINEQVLDVIELFNKLKKDMGYGA